MTLLVGCGKEDAPIPKPEKHDFFYTNGRWIREPLGRVALLRGLNVSNRHKWPPFYADWLDENEWGKISSLGFNSARFLIIWEAVEPEPLRYDDSYIDMMLQSADQAVSNGVLPIIDMHQDLFARKFGGDGAPEWAVRDEGIPFEPAEPWFANYYSEAVMKSFDNFWDNVDRTQDYFIAAWVHVADRFADRKGVVGYDLFNEPFCGSSRAVNDPEFDTKKLRPFYEKLIAAIREVDPNHIIFFEPNILKASGIDSYIGRMDFENLVYAPHYYDSTVTLDKSYDGNWRRHQEVFSGIWDEAERMGTPWWLGEFGTEFDAQNAGQYLEDHLKLLDDFIAGWELWNFDREDGEGGMGIEDLQGNLRWPASVLSRPYPLFTAGEPTRISFDADTKEFAFSFATAGNPGGESVIFLPGNDFGENFSVESTDAEGDWSYRFEKESRMLYLKADPDQKEHTITIKP